MSEVKANLLPCCPVAAKACVVSFIDHRGVRHSVRVRAESLFEAAASALAEFRRSGWIETQPGSATQLEVKVRGPATKHTVSVQQLRRWAESTAVTPADRIKRETVKRLLSPPPKSNGHRP